MPFPATCYVHRIEAVPPSRSREENGAAILRDEDTQLDFNVGKRKGEAHHTLTTSIRDGRMPRKHCSGWQNQKTERVHLWLFCPRTHPTFWFRAVA
jgi:hypothetical protein